MKPNHLITTIVWLLITFITMVSCDRQRVLDIYKPLSDSGWHVDSLQLFTFDIASTAQNHNLYFNIRNDRSYGFSNLWLFVKIIPPEGELITDTIQVLLAHPAGKWIGKGFSGIYTNQIAYRTHVYFPVRGKYIIQIQHGMRPKVLEGLTDIGIRVEKSPG